MTRIILVRHAEAMGNQLNEFHGWTDSVLTERGHLQAARMAQSLRDAHVTAIYASPLQRTQQTAGYLAELLGLPVFTVHDMKEINGGLFECRHFDELPVLFPDEHAAWENTPHIAVLPEGEAVSAFTERVSAALLEIARAEEGRTVCIFTHGTVIRVLIHLFLGLPPERLVEVPWCENTAVTHVNWDKGHFHMVEPTDDSHLPDELASIRHQPWYLEYLNNKGQGVLQQLMKEAYDHG